MVSYVVSRVIMLVFGTLYPAYSSYKAIKMKNVREYVRWMMYWIVFALFIAAELFADLLLAFWFPFYYEIKIIFMLWLLSPATKGSSILYRKFVHPWLSRHEKDIDAYIIQAKESGYDTLLRVSRNGLTVAADTMMRTAATGQTVLAEKLRQYGTDTTDNSKQGRLHKAKSWYGGMHSPDNDYVPIDESEEFNLDEIAEENSTAEAESMKLQDDMQEDTDGPKIHGIGSARTTGYRSSTLPRSFGKTSSRPRVYGSEYDYFESSTLPRHYEHASSRAQPERSLRTKKTRSLPVLPKD